MADSKDFEKKLTIWKAEARALPVRVQGSTQTSNGEVYLRHWERPARMKRALKAWGMCWGGAVVAVLIPGLHFVLVPGLLLAGLIVPVVVFQQESAILGGLSECPKCGKPLPLVGGKDRWPLHDVCSACFESVVIEKA